MSARTVKEEREDTETKVKGRKEAGKKERNLRENRALPTPSVRPRAFKRFVSLRR